MGAEIDRLEIEVEAQATKANNALDKLVGNLERLAGSLGSINGNSFLGFSKGISDISSAMQRLKSADIGKTDFNRLAKGIDELRKVDSSKLTQTASAMIAMSDAIKGYDVVSGSAEAIGSLAKGIAKFGNKSTLNAIDNMPKLTTAMNDLMVTLSKTPAVSDNIIQMTNALANLASNGSRVGSSAQNVTNNLNGYSVSAQRASKSSRGLASAIGSLYANFFLVKRGADKLWKSIESSMDYLETVNYFEVAMRKLGEDASANWKQAGYDSAEAYASSFSTRAKQLTAKMTGYEVDEKGNATYTGQKNLGMNPDTIMNYQAMFAQVSESIGVAEESALNFSTALTMLGTDWASLRNTTFEQAFEKFASALAGQSRAVRAFGIDITNATLQEYAYKYGLTTTVTEMNQATKAQLRLLAILDQSKVAFGDLANTIDSPSNQLRMLRQNFNNLARTIGNLFLPIVQTVLPYINGLIMALQRLFSWIGSLLGIKLDSINSSIGGISDDMTDLIGDADDYTDSLNNASDAAKKLKNNLQSWHEINNITTQDDSSSNKGGSKGGIPELDSKIGDALKEYEDAWNKAFDNMKNKAKEFADKVYDAFELIRQIIKDFVDGDFFKAGQDVSKLVIKIFNWIADAIDKVDWYGIGQKIGDFLAGIEWIKILGAVAKAIWQALKAALELYAGMFSSAPIETAIITMIAIPKILKAITASKFVSGIKKLTEKFKGLNKSFSDYLQNLDATGQTLTFDNGVKKIRSNLTKLQKGFIGVIAVAAEFVLVKDAFYDITKGSDNLLKSIGKIAGAAAVASAALYVAFGPAGLAVAAITGVVAAVSGISKAMKEIRAEEIGETIKNALSNPGGTPISEVASKCSDAIGKIGDSFTILTEKSSEIDTANSHIRSTWQEIEQIEVAMDTGVLSVDKGTEDLKLRFEDLAKSAQTQFGALLDTLTTAFGENGVLKDIYNRLGVSTENTVTMITELHGEVEQKINELTNELSTMDPSNPLYAKYKQELAELMAQTDELTSAMNDYEFALQQIDYSELIKNDGSINTDKLQSLLSDLSSATETANQKITDAIGGIDKALREELQKAINVGDVQKQGEIRELLDALPNALDMLKSDVTLKAKELTDTIQTDLIGSVDQVIDDSKAKWNEKDFWSKVFSGTSGEGYIQDAIGQQADNIKKSSDLIESTFNELGVEGAGWASDAFDKICKSLFDTDHIHTYSNMFVTKVTLPLKSNYKKILADSTSELPLQSSKSGEKIVDGLNSGIKANQSSTSSAAQEWLKKGESGIRNSVMKFNGNTSKCTYDYGSATVKSYNKGITDNKGSSVTTMNQYMQSVANTANNIVPVFRNIGSDAMKAFAEGMESGGKDVANRLSQNMTNTMSDAVANTQSPELPSLKRSSESMSGKFGNTLKQSIGQYTAKSINQIKKELSVNQSATSISSRAQSMSDYNGYPMQGTGTDMRETNDLLRLVLQAVLSGHVITMNTREVGKALQEENRKMQQMRGKGLFEF